MGTRRDQLETLFDAIVDLPPEERRRILDARCAADPSLRAEIDALLAADVDNRPTVATGIRRSVRIDLDATVDSETTPVRTTDGLPERIDQYRPIRIIGEGGMGVVYEAEQDRPKRRVALKMINAPFVTPGLLRRFEVEAEVLAQLRHPGIAQIYDAGTVTTEAGQRPFFAMELVDGAPIDRYADEKRLGVRERLELIVKICRAIEHAHQRGIIHRDLKPGNILVTEIAAEEAQPKILDFGVARATGSDLRATMAQTGMGQIIGTLPYMSPEQASGDPDALDTRSDVYALGVVAYELLTGQLPYSLDREALHDAVRIIQEEVPTRMSSTNRSLAGDVETIVTTALRKEKEHRYQSALALASDIERYLSDEPISARPASTLYQLSKFAKRNKVLVGGVASVFVTLVAGLVVSISMYLSAEEQRGRAEAINGFLLEDLIREATPDGSGEEITLVEALRRAEPRLEERFKTRPEHNMEVRLAVSNMYFGLGETDRATASMDILIDYDRRVLGPEHPTTVRHECKRADGALHNTTDPAKEERVLISLLARAARILGPEDAATLQTRVTLANAVQTQGRYAEAETTLREVMATIDARGTSLVPMSPDWDTYVRALNMLAASYLAQDRLDDVDPIMDKLLEMIRSGDGRSLIEATVVVASQRGVLLIGRREYARAAEAYEEALALARERLSVDHYALMYLTGAAGYTLRKQGRFEESEPLLLEAYERFTARPDSNPHQLEKIIGHLKDLYRDWSKPAERETWMVRHLEQRRIVEDNPNHVSVLKRTIEVATFLLELGNVAEALRQIDLTLAEATDVGEEGLPLIETLRELRTQCDEPG